MGVSPPLDIVGLDLRLSSKNEPDRVESQIPQKARPRDAKLFDRSPKITFS
jgi:hypothetical protein